MLKIQVLGNGLIPRGLGLAPRKNPFPADYTLISTIMNSGNLRVNYLNPEDGRILPLNRTNLKRVWDKYADWDANHPQTTTTTQPHVPEEPPQTPPNTEPPAEEPPKSEEPPATGEQVPPEKPEITPSVNSTFIQNDEKKNDVVVDPAAATAAAMAAMGAIPGETKEEEKPEGKADEKAEPSGDTEKKDETTSTGSTGSGFKPITQNSHNNKNKNHH